MQVKHSRRVRCQEKPAGQDGECPGLYGLTFQGGERQEPLTDIWWVYLAVGANGHLYCGISTDPERRVRAHNRSKKGSKCVSAHRPLRLVYEEYASSKGAALERERQIKRLSATAKRLLAGIQPKPSEKVEE